MGLGFVLTFPQGSAKEKHHQMRRRQLASISQRIANTIPLQMNDERFRLPERTLAERKAITPAYSIASTNSKKYDENIVTQFLTEQGVASIYHPSLIPLIDSLVNETYRRAAFYGRNSDDVISSHVVQESLAAGLQWTSLQQMDIAFEAGRVFEKLVKQKSFHVFVRTLARSKRGLLISQDDSCEFIPHFSTASQAARAREKPFLMLVAEVLQVPHERVLSAHRKFTQLTSGVACRMPIVTSLPEQEFIRDRVDTEYGDLTASTGTDSYGKYQVQLAGQKLIFIHDFYIHSARTKSVSDRYAGQVVLPRLCLEPTILSQLQQCKFGQNYLNALRGLVALTDHDYLHQLDGTLLDFEVSTRRSSYYRSKLEKCEVAVRRHQQVVQGFEDPSDYELSLTLLHRDVLRKFNKRCGGAIGRNVDQRLIETCKAVQELTARNVITPAQATYCMTVYLNFFSLIRPITSKLEMATSSSLTWEPGLTLKGFHGNIVDNKYGAVLTHDAKPQKDRRIRQLQSRGKVVIRRGIELIEAVAAMGTK
jgi:hypothetical protein